MSIAGGALLANEALKTYKRDAPRLEIDASGYEDVEKFAVRVGEGMSRAMEKTLKQAGLSTFDQETAEAFVMPLLTKAYEIIAGSCEVIQNTLNREANIRLKAVRPAFPADRSKNLVDKLASYDAAADALWVLDEPVVMWCLHLVDASVIVNAETLAAAGFMPSVRRISDSATCSYCNSQAGEYFPPFAGDITRRHERCRCLILLKLPRTITDEVRRTAEAEQDARRARIARVMEAEKRLRRDG